MKKLLLGLLLSAVLVPSAHSAFVFNPSVSMFEREVETNNTKTEAKYTYLDIRAGYLFDFGLYVGGLYSNANEQAGGDSSDFFFGPSVGYHFKGLSLLLTYFLNGQSDLSSGGTKYDDVSGYQVDLAYQIMIGKTFGLGPMMSYRAVSFDEQQLQGISQPGFNGRDQTTLTPSFSFWFHFQ